jgi:hypothetical protein
MLALNDARRFGSVDLVASTALDLWPAFAALGPEPLGDGLSVAHLAAAFKGRIGPVKLLLLDQGIVAGLGNIYVCEALHRAHISPLRSGGSIKKAELTRLVPAIRDVLSDPFWRAARRSAIMPSPMASWAISRPTGASMGGRVRPASRRAARARLRGLRRVDAPPSGARRASVKPIVMALSA